MNLIKWIKDKVNLEIVPKVMTDDDWMQQFKCPDCHGDQFYEGPSGGMNTNWECATEGCGSKFNIAVIPYSVGGSSSKSGPPHVHWERI